MNRDLTKIQNNGKFVNNDDPYLISKDILLQNLGYINKKGFYELWWFIFVKFKPVFMNAW